MKDKTLIAVTTITAITTLETVALYLGINGTVLSLAMGSIAGVAGYEIKNVGIEMKRGKEKWLE